MNLETIILILILALVIIGFIGTVIKYIQSYINKTIALDKIDDIIKIKAIKNIGEDIDNILSKIDGARVNKKRNISPHNEDLIKEFNEYYNMDVSQFEKKSFKYTYYSTVKRMLIRESLYLMKLK